MSITELRSTAVRNPERKVSVQTLVEKKRKREPITALTAYDFPTARLLDAAGIDVVLVGDSVAMTVLGHENTLSLTVDEMLHHARAVRRGIQHAFMVVDMPYGSYHVSTEETLQHALRFVKQAGAEAVKLEGGRSRALLVERLTAAEIPVIGHIGLTPQSLHRMGGYRVQGRSMPEAEALLADAVALQQAGAIALVLEGIPRELTARITAKVIIPTIGIGAGPDCDGQVLVFNDLFRLTFAPAAKFVRSVLDLESLMLQGLAEYRAAVEDRSFPSDAESYHLPREVAAQFAESYALDVRS